MQGANTLTPEQLRLSLTLSGIFMPHAYKQREEAIREQTAPGEPPTAFLRFAHYTSAEAALKIISSKRLWMRNALCMSDRSEVQHGADILDRYFKDGKRQTSFVAELDKCFKGAAAEAMAGIHNWGRDIKLDTYILSVSEHDKTEDQHGRLSMWRAFGDSSTRVAIVFKVPLASASALDLRITFSPISYLTKDEAHDELRQVIENVKTNVGLLQGLDRNQFVGMIFVMFLAVVTCLKHEGFREEREWRAIYSPNRLASPLMESETEIVRGVPQIVYKIPLDRSKSPDLADLDFSNVFDRIIIGPSPYPWVLYKAFSDALEKAGIQSASERVRVSGIPIRV